MHREVVSIKHSKQFNDIATTVSFRVTVFNCGDCLFLLLVGMTTTLAMHLAHRSGWDLAFVLPVGMAIATVIQMLLALAVAPVLGSIESMVPSMVVAMIVPLLVCLLDLMGIGMSEGGTLALGAAGGLGIFLLLKSYGRRCRKSLGCAFPPK